MVRNILLRSSLAGALFVACAAWGQTIPDWTPTVKWSRTVVRCPSQTELETLTRRASAGEAEAQDRLGTFHIGTCDGNKNASEGIQLLERAAAQGNSHAQLTLARAYMDGKGVPQDLEKSLRWIEKAALNDDAKAQNNLGVVLRL